MPSPDALEARPMPDSVPGGAAPQKDGYHKGLGPARMGDMLANPKTRVALGNLLTTELGATVQRSEGVTIVGFPSEGGVYRRESAPNKVFPGSTSVELGHSGDTVITIREGEEPGQPGQIELFNPAAGRVQLTDAEARVDVSSGTPVLVVSQISDNDPSRQIVFRGAKRLVSDEVGDGEEPRTREVTVASIADASI